jgi:hypothetical protein
MDVETIRLVETMLKNQQDVAVKAELEYLDGDFRPQQALPDFRSFGVSPECANPKCQTEFHWLAEGEFFRFRTEGDGSANEKKSHRGAPTKHHGVRHYWLCKRCSAADGCLPRAWSGPDSALVMRSGRFAQRQG